jgi:hypothetical protein
VPFKIAMAKEIRRIDVEFKSVATATTFLEEDIGR